MANSILGQRLKELRNESRLTQQDAADRLGLKSKSTISMWESGKTEPDILSFLALCCEYGLPEAKQLIKALNLEDSAAFDFAAISFEEKDASTIENYEPNTKPYAFCPYCGEKLK